MVDRLEQRLAPTVVLACVHRVVGVALHLLRPALHDPHQQPLAGRALLEDGGVEGVSASDQVLGHPNRALDMDLLVGHVTAVEHHGPDARDSHPLQKLSACQPHGASTSSSDT